MLFLLVTIEQNALSQRRDRDELYEQLLVQIAAGDLLALEKLYTASKSAVYGFVLSILKNRESAEDVMQETYVKIYQAAQQYQPQKKPMAWILTIARNLSLMKLRESRRITDGYEVDWSTPVQNDFTENSIDRIVLQKAVTCLADDEWQIVSLHSVSGLKHREIAEILEIPLSTALSKYHRALSKLKKALKEEMA